MFFKVQGFKWNTKNLQRRKRNQTGIPSWKVNIFEVKKEVWTRGRAENLLKTCRQVAYSEPESAHRIASDQILSDFE